jgi:hypothetical protein
MSKVYCAAPWRGLHITPQGDLKTCCSGANLIGNINYEDINTLLSKPIITEIRDSIRQGTLHPNYCSNCIKAEQYGNSERAWHNNLSPEIDFASDVHVPTLIDIRWNTTCNLACNYCGPFASSKWENRLQVKNRTKTREFATELIDYIKQHTDTVREVGLVGGEPLLLKENDLLLDIIPKDCVVTIITNCNVDFNSNTIAQKLFARRRVGWSMSFDNVGKQMEYVRYGSNWELTDKNVRHIRSNFANEHWGGIHAVYNIYNCTRIRELRRYANEVDLDIVWQSLTWPEFLDPFKHSKPVRELALKELDAYEQEFGVKPLEQEFFTKARAALIAGSEAYEIGLRFKKHIHKTETQWHDANSPCFQELWPELAEVIL